MTSLTDSCGAIKEDISITGYLLFYFAHGYHFTTESRNNVSNCMADYCKEPSVCDLCVLCVVDFFPKCKPLGKGQIRQEGKVMSLGMKIQIFF